MRNGSGDEWFLLFDVNGAALKGFAHERASDTPLAQEIQRQVPNNFSAFLSEPAFSMQDATFCYWRSARDPSWNKVTSALAEDGSKELLAWLIRGPAGYREWAENHFEVPVDIKSVSTVFAHQPLTESLVRTLNPGCDPEFAYAQADEIGYPL